MKKKEAKALARARETQGLAYTYGTVAAVLTFLVFNFGRPETPWFLDIAIAAMVGFFVAVMVEGIRRY